MKILAVDTSTEVASVAMIDKKKILYNIKSDEKKTHSQLIMPMIAETMTNCEMSPNDVDIYAVVTGPGSFTGLRIGVSTIKALAYSTNKKVVAVNSLESLALNVNGHAKYICPIIDARNNSVYTAVYQSNEDFPTLIYDFNVLNIEELAKLLKEKGDSVIFTGNGLKNHREFFEANLKEIYIPCKIELTEANAVSAALIAYKSYLNCEYSDCYNVNVNYMRPSQAERLFKSETSTK